MPTAEAESLAPALGEGIISFPAAARLLHKPTNTVRSWIRSGLTPATYGRTDQGSHVLSFHDLVSLEIIRRLRNEGVSLQRIRVLESELRRRHPEWRRPFAHQVFFTDGANVWGELHQDRPELQELVGSQRGHLVWRDAIRSFATEIRYDEAGLAQAWHLHERIVVDPAVQFGSPTIAGYRVTVDAVLAALETGATAEEVADLLGVEVADVQAAQDFVDAS